MQRLALVSVWRELTLTAIGCGTRQGDEASVISPGGMEAGQSWELSPVPFSLQIVTNFVMMSSVMTWHGPRATLGPP
jgi:hypothetical protein